MGSLRRRVATVITTALAAGLALWFWLLSRPDEPPLGHGVEVSASGGSLTKLSATIGFGAARSASINGVAVVACTKGSISSVTASTSAEMELTLQARGGPDSRGQLVVKLDRVCTTGVLEVRLLGHVDPAELSASLGPGRELFDVALRGYSHDGREETDVRLTVDLGPFSRFEATYGASAPGPNARTTTWSGRESVQASGVASQPDVSAGADRILDLLLVAVGAVLGLLVGGPRGRSSVEPPRVVEPPPVARRRRRLLGSRSTLSGRKRPRRPA